MSDDLLAKVIVFYFPQFHAIPENDEWWGKGFTDWDNVKRGTPAFKDHSQPRVPVNNRYYDQSSLDTIRWQTDLAKQYGVSGFCHYHYWFDGKQLLETPTNLFMQTKDIDFPFCLAWANETWSRRWDGQDHYILQEQTHTPSIEKWKHHFSYLIKAWSDDRAIRIDGKPLFIIYRPAKIQDTGGMFDYWQQEARKYGIDGLYFATMKQSEFPDESCLEHYDAVIQFQPFEAMYSANFSDRRSHRLNRLAQTLISALPQGLENILFRLRKNMSSPTLIDYDATWNRILERPQEPGITTFPGAFVDWDNTARYGRRATIFKGANPERFEYWLSQLVQNVAADTQRAPLIFLNAWNEWSEGTYLEPDTRYGKQYLEALLRCVKKLPQ